MEYGPHFQRIESVHFDRKAKTALAKVRYTRPVRGMD